MYKRKAIYLNVRMVRVWQWDMWQPGMAIDRFYKSGCLPWYADKLEALLDMGVDCFKTDFGERIPTDVGVL